MISSSVLQRIGIASLVIGLALRLAGRNGYLLEFAGYNDIFYWVGLAFWGFGFVTRKKSSTSEREE